MTTGTTNLTEREREILEFERHWWKHQGAKEGMILEAFDCCSPTLYYAELNRLLDRPEAIAADPMTVRRLLRLRELRRQRRSARRLA